MCIDSTTGYPGHYWIPFSEIAIWPTHSRFRASKAGRVATDESELMEALNFYLENPQADLHAMRKFRQQECANLDGSAGRRTAEYFLSLLEQYGKQSQPVMTYGLTYRLSSMIRKLRAAKAAFLKTGRGAANVRSPFDIPAITPEEVAEIKRFFPDGKVFHLRACPFRDNLADPPGARAPGSLLQLPGPFFYPASPCCSRWSTDPKVGEWLTRRSNRWNRGRDLSPVILRAAADFIMERDARKASKSITGDKSPNSLLNGDAVRLLVRVYPDARLVFIVRDGRDAAISHRFQAFIDNPQPAIKGRPPNSPGIH